MGEATERSVRRFPVTLLSAVVAAVSAIMLVDAVDEHPLAEILMTALLGIPLFLAVGLVAARRERWHLPRYAGLVLRLAALAFLVAYGFTRSGELFDHELVFHVQLTVGLHLLVAVLPFAGRGEVGAMWRFNVTLLLRFINAAFFSMVLFAGLSLALAALDTLFGVDVKDDVYMQLWLGIALVFNTAYFLGGVPGNLSDLGGPAAYPKVLRIFAQYILAPLVCVYLAILTAYLVKVVATAEWPSGWIGYLVSGVAAAGLLSLLLLEPESERSDRRWLRVYARAFHIFMLPAVVMLALAVLKRIGQYGVTEFRYFLLVLTVWLAVVVVWGCVRKRSLIKAVPASLAVIALLTAIGPWSAKAVSLRSQHARLEGVLAENGRLAEGMIASGESTISLADRVEITSILQYLFSLYGSQALGDLADAELAAELDERAELTTVSHNRTTGLARTVGESMGMELAYARDVGVLPHYEFQREDGAAIPVRDFEYFVRTSGALVEVHAFEIEGQQYRATMDWASRQLAVTRAGVTVVVFSVNPTIDDLRSRYPNPGSHQIAGDLLDVVATTDLANGLLRIRRIAWSESSGADLESGSVSADLLLSITPDDSGPRE